MNVEQSNVSSKAEEYLEVIYRLEKKTGLAKTMEIARQLEVVPGSVTNTINSLESRGLVIHKPYKGVKLTEKGEKIALNVLRRHRLAERLLTDVLHMDWSEAHDAACKLEHAITPEIINPLRRAVGHPKTCPHGNPVPPKGGKPIEEESKLLIDLKNGETGIVVKVTEEERSTLKHLADLGLVPGATVKIAEKSAPNALLTIRVEGEQCALDRKAAKNVHIKPSGTPSGGLRSDQ